jgi:hypothetical protein
VALVTDAVPPDAPDWQRNLDRRGQLSQGSVLIRNVLSPGVYVSAEEADQRIAHTKTLHFASLCQLLGARSVDAELVVQETGEKTREFDLKAGKAGGPRGTVKALSKALSEKVASFELSSTYEGGEPDLESARALLRSTGLDGDPTLVGLVDARTHRANPVNEQTVFVKLSTEAIRTITAGANIVVPAFVKVEVDMKQVARQAETFSVRYHVKF